MCTSLLVYIAGLPPFFRNQHSFRIFSFLARKLELQGLVNTNMGIDEAYDCLVPVTYSPAIFGRPEYYCGERGALYLSALLSRYSDAFIDAGAYAGYYIFYLRKYGAVDIPVYYFEPDPDMYRLIKNNISENEIQNVYGYCMALSEIDGEVDFYKNISDTSSSSLSTMFVDRHITEKITVQAARFDTFALQHDFQQACVKADIEGAEIQFIRGATNVMKRIRFLIMEMLAPALKDGLVQYLIRENNMHAYYINDFNLEYSPRGCFDYQSGEFNWLFCRESPHELQKLLNETNNRMKIKISHPA